MNWLNEILKQLPMWVYYLLALLIALIFSEQYGENRIQDKWDTQKAIDAALVAAQDQKNKETLDDLKAQHEKDIEFAKAQAGRDAVNRWLHDHGLLPDGTPMFPGNSVSTEGSKVSNGTPGQSGLGDKITQFATDCAKDALMVMDWQELCKRNNCVVE